MSTPTIYIVQGSRFGRLTALRENGRKNKKVAWLCLCECGKESTVVSTRLRNGETTSCGCFRAISTRAHKTRHGKARRTIHTPEYSTWIAIRDRCENQNNKRFSAYGGRGIKVCDRWQVFQNFAADMGLRPARHSIDRINNDGDYEPNNCRWATHTQQSANKRTNVKVTIGDVTKTVTEWAREHGVRPGLYFRRIAIGWTPERAVTTPKLALDRTLSEEPVV